ncbi:retropepsin-like aspartic protease family protein [Maricaulis sp.]|uniref:retropepsin-like aspartic protease family protein n=1 Tax=Maricaulis sp. TaxID=1486257 RepID=UPI003A92861A
MKRWLPHLALAALVIAAVLLAMRFAAPGSLDDSDTALRLVYSAGLIVLISSGLVGAFATRPGHAVRDLAIWIGIGLVLMTGYALREDFAIIAGRVTGNLVPARAQGEAGGEQTIRRNADGHFYIVSEVDGRPVLFLVDTGASMVALSRADAERAGIDTAALRFNRPIQTASGTSSAAGVRLRSMRLGGLELHDVEAIVMIDGGQSLLGMSALNRLSGVEIRGDELVLRP